MRVDLLRSRRLIKGDEAVQQVVAGRVVVVTPREVGEVVAKVRIRELLGEQIDFV